MVKIKNLKRESGQSLVEFAIILPLLLLIVFGIIQFGFLFNAKMVITSTAREGARKAVVTSYNDRTVASGNVEAAIYQSLTTNSLLNLNINNLDYNDDAMDPDKIPGSGIVWWYIFYPDTTHKSGDTLFVYIKGKQDITIPIISNIIGNEVPIAANAAMRIERE